jgi:16S rRNA (guanine1207-N2)-methyltransferase
LTKARQARNQPANSAPGPDLTKAIVSKVKPPLAVALGAPGEVVQWLTLLGNPTAVCYQVDLYLAEQLRMLLVERGLVAEVRPAADLWDLPRDQQTVLYLPSRTGERDLKIDMAEQAFHLLRDDGNLVVHSPYFPDELFPGLLKKLFGSVKQTVVGEQTVFWSTRKGEHSERRHEVTFHVRLNENESLRFLSRPGVFAYGRFDDGARALTEEMEVHAGDEILDLGCGCGTNGIIAVKRAGGEASVVFVDSNLRALALTAENAKNNGVEKFIIHGSHSLADIPGGEFDVVLANPPYFAANVICQMFVDAAARYLRPNGRLYLVTKQIEPAGEILSEYFTDIEVAQRRGYQIFCCLR